MHKHGDIIQLRFTAKKKKSPIISNNLGNVTHGHFASLSQATVIE